MSTVENPDARLLLTPKQAAQAMAISPRKLWGLTFEDERRLRHVRCGRLVRYRPSDLEAYIESRMAPASS